MHKLHANRVRHHCVYLRDQVFSDSLGKFPPGTVEDHLQHVPTQLFHHHEYPLRSLKHSVQVNYGRVVEILQVFPVWHT